MKNLIANDSAAHEDGGHSSTQSLSQIPRELWVATLLIASQSFAAGYAFSSINPCLAIGHADESGDCIHSNGLCPPGSLYNDVHMSTIQVTTCVFGLVSDQLHCLILFC
jgi:hypothetical protein